MQLKKVGFAAIITLLLTVSTSGTSDLFVQFATPQILAQTQDNLKVSAEQLFQQGNEQYHKGQLEAAVESWQQALTIYQQLQDRLGEGTTLGNLGTAYISLRRYNKAIECLQPFLSIAKAMGDRQGEAQALGELGIAYKTLGNYDKAIEFHQQALAIMRELKNHQGEGRVLINLGNAYEALGNYDQAIASYEASLVIVQKIGDRLGEVAILANRGGIYANQGKYDQAIESYQQSLSIARAIGDKEGEANTFYNLGLAHHFKGDLKQAVEYYTQSLTIARAIGDRLQEAKTLSSIGIAYEDQRDFKKAIAHQQETLKIAREIGDRRLEALAYNNLGHALKSAGKLAEAEKKLTEALKVFESLRPGLTDADNISVFDTQVFSYNLLQQILIDQKKPEAALEIAERGRARAFVELLAQRWSVQAAQKYKANEQLPSIEQIQQIAKAQNATLVEYSIVPDDSFKFQGKLRGPASELFIWVVQPNGKVAFRQVSLKDLHQQQGKPTGNTPTLLEDLVNTSRELAGVLASRNKPVRQKLYQLLIEPIAEFLPKDPKERVIFIPQESLFSLPFPALQDASGQYLIEKHTILTAPAIQVLALTHQQRQRQSEQKTQPIQQKDVLVVGNPKMPPQLDPLPSAQQEALAIAEIFNTKAITGEQATKVNIVQQLPKAKLVHLATHGLVGNIDHLGFPAALAKRLSMGSIVLGSSEENDGFLTAEDIFNLRLNAELVVLSACNTGRGTITGDGVIGLSRSLISAGVPSVIVSLWSIPDAPTAMLMEEFYRNLKLNPDKAQSLRQAMLTTMKQQPNPYNWAAFTIIGEAD